MTRKKTKRTVAERQPKPWELPTPDPPEHVQERLRESVDPRFAGLSREEQRSREVRILAARFRRWAGFSIADFEWLRENAAELAERVYCDRDDGEKPVPTPSPPPKASSGDPDSNLRARIRPGGGGDPVPGLAARRDRDPVTRMCEAFEERFRGARRAASDARRAGQRVRSTMDPKAAREATEVERETLEPGVCENCGKTVYPPGEYLRDDRCDACRKYWERTKAEGEPRERPVPAEGEVA